MKVVEFSAFAPVALAGIGKLPDTIRSRSIQISMRRRAPGEKIRPYRERITRPEGEALRCRLAAWVKRHGDQIAEDPALPEGVTDRQADQWEPLVAIADAADGDWPRLARLACSELATLGRAPDDASFGIRLLAEIRDVFDGRDRLDTAALIAGLCDLDDAPFDEWLEGKSDKARGGWLAKHLEPYGIGPTKIRFGDVTAKGYRAVDFADVWQRYLPDKGNRGNKGNTPCQRCSLCSLCSLWWTGQQRGEAVLMLTPTTASPGPHPEEAPPPSGGRGLRDEPGRSTIYATGGLMRPHGS